MEKKTKTKAKQFKINFDFSDDSGDDFDTPQAFNLKHTQAKNKHLSRQSNEQNNATIISSEYLCRQAQLLSFTEDIGLPIMDSTHLVVENKVPRGSVCTDISKAVLEKLQIVEACDDKGISTKNYFRDNNGHVDNDQEKWNRGKENAPCLRKDAFHNRKSDSCGRSKFQDGDGSIHINTECKISEREDCLPKSDVITSSNSFVEVEVQDFSVQTSFYGDNNPSSNIPLDVPTKQMPSRPCFIEKDEKDVDNSNFSKLPDSSNEHYSTSVPCGQTSADRFTTALEDSANLFSGLQSSNEGMQSKPSVYHSYDDKEESEFGTDLVDNDSNTNSNCVSASQEPSSYYVQDMSLQTSLPFSEISVSSSNQVFKIHRNSTTKMHTSPISLHSSDTKRSQPQNQHGVQQSSVISMSGNSHSVYDTFQITSSAKENPADVLAVDSDTNSFSDDDKNNTKDSVVIADSEDESSENNSPKTSVSIISERKTASVDSDQCEEDDDQLDKSLENASAVPIDNKFSIVKDCNEENQLAETKKIDEVTSSLSALSFRQGTSASHRMSSSSEDDNFEAFLIKTKGEPKGKGVQEERDIPSMEDFIVDDNEDSSQDEDADDKLFYIRTTNTLDKKGKERELVEKSYVYYTSSSSESGHASDSDLSDFIVDDEANHQRKTRHSTKDKDKVKSGSSEKNSLGSQNEFQVALEKEERDTKTKRGGDKKNVLKTKSIPTRPKPWPSIVTPATRWSSDSDDDFVVDEAHRQRKTWHYQNSPQNEHQISLGKEERDTKTKRGGDKKNVLKTKSTPTRPKPWPSSVTPATRWSSDSDDDFVVRRDDTSSKTSLPLPFKTPKQIPKTKEFETPVTQKVPKSHPWTAPKPLQPSRSSLEDDDTFFLKSLSSDYASYKRHPEAARYVKGFKSLKEELTTKLFEIFNGRVFDSKIPSTISLEWNARYTKTAGSFSYKRSDLTVSKITLSVKVCDRPERVRDTLVHELCHAAVRLINGANESHGPVWKSWARKVNRAFPFMPVVARCHDYIIHNKYTYQCVNCKYKIGRHSKSLDTERKVCGHCKGEFQVFLTSELNSSDSSTVVTPRTPRTPNKFALYVKECYSEVKKRNANLKHGDVMKELSKEFAEKNKIK